MRLIKGPQLTRSWRALTRHVRKISPCVRNTAGSSCDALCEAASAFGGESRRRAPNDGAVLAAKTGVLHGN